MPGPGAPQTATPAPAPAPLTPWWEALAQGVRSAHDWLNETAAPWVRQQLGVDPEKYARFQQQLNTQLAAPPPIGGPRADPLTSAVVHGTTQAAKRVGQQLKEDYAHQWTPEPGVASLADMAHQHIAERSEARHAALDDPALAPVDWMASAQEDWIPNHLVDLVANSSTGAGALSNFGDAGPALKAGGAVGAKLASLPFVPGMRRPGLTKSGRAAIEEARAYLQDLGLKGPVARGELETVLKQAPLAHAHHVTKDLPVEAPLGEARRILMPGDAGFDLAPAATSRVHGMADIGAALPFQANWGNAVDPEMLPAFGNDRRAAELFGRFFAALSPRTSVPKNAQEAIKVWDEYLRHPGRTFTDERLRELGVGNVRSKTDNLLRAIIGDDPRGEKVDLFTDYLAGHALLPVPDVHGLYGIGSQHKSIDSVIPELKRLVQEHEGIPAKGGGLTNKDYVHRLVDAFGRSLQAYDPEKPMGPLFGSTWEGIRAQKGLSPQGGMIDIYRSRGLAEPGAMLDSRALGRAIREWLDQAKRK